MSRSRSPKTTTCCHEEHRAAYAGVRPLYFGDEELHPEFCKLSQDFSEKHENDLNQDKFVKGESQFGF